MVGAGVPRLVVSKILNHVETGVTAVYDRHSYDLEKRAALDFWVSDSRRSSRTSDERVSCFDSPRRANEPTLYSAGTVEGGG